MMQDWKKLITIQAGGAICLPVFIIGHALAKTYGIYSAILAIFIGNLFLLSMGSVFAASCAEHKKSTAECAVEVFGSRGKKLFSLVMIFSMVGWFAIQLNIMSSSLESFIGPDFNLVLNLSLGAIITLVGIKGMRSLDILASLSMPVLILTIFYALYLASQNPIIANEPEELTFGGISLVLACGIAAIIDLPTFFRMAKTKKDGIIAACLLFGCVLPLIESIGLYLFMHAEGENLVQVLAQETSPLLWKIWVMAFLILAGWTTNNANLYSASISLKTYAPKIESHKGIILIGTAGMLLSCMDLLENLGLALDIMGIVLASMGAVIVFHFGFGESKCENQNIAIWSLGVLYGLSAHFGYSILHIPVLDAFLFALILKIIMKVIKNEKFINVRS